MKERFMTDRAFYKMVFAITVPIAMQMVISFGVNIMDSVMLGKLGDLAISGASLGGQPFYLLMGLGFGLTSGGSVLIAQYWGKGNADAIRRIMALSLWCVTIASFLLFVACACFPSQIMRIYSDDPAVIDAATQYLQVLAFGFMFYSMSNNYLSSLRAVESVKVSTLIYVVSFFVNVGANYIFIYGNLGMPRLEIRGAALGTVIARGSEFVLAFLYMYFKENKIQFRVSDMFKFDKVLLKDYIANALPVVGNEMLWSLGSSTMAMIMGRIGAVLVAANSISGVIWQLANLFVIGIANAAAVVTGKAIGEGRADESQKIANSLQAMGVASGVFAGIVIMLLRVPFLGLYDVSPETRQVALQIILMQAFLQPLIAYDIICTIGILRGGGDTKMAFLLDCGALWLVGVPLAYFSGLVWSWAPPLVYLMMKMDSPVKDLLLFLRIRSGKWVRNVTRDDV